MNGRDLYLLIVASLAILCIKKSIRMVFKIQLLLLVTIILTACGKSTQECAEESLIGEWRVTQIYESRSIIENGVQIDQSQTTYDNTSGHFSFTNDMMQYVYTTTTSISSEQGYSLVTTKENSGFTRVNVFTIKGDDEDFRVRFGDQTSDAHEDAEEISLEQSLTSDTLMVDRYIDLVRE